MFLVPTSRYASIPLRSKQTCHLSTKIGTNQGQTTTFETALILAFLGQGEACPQYIPTHGALSLFFSTSAHLRDSTHSHQCRHSLGRWRALVWEKATIENHWGITLHSAKYHQLSEKGKPKEQINHTDVQSPKSLRQPLRLTKQNILLSKITLVA